MRFLLLTLLSAPLLAPAQPLPATVPDIGVIEIYGNRKTSAEDIRKTLGIAEGQKLPASKGELEEKLEAMPDVVAGRLAAVCCDEDKMILYIGVEEKGAPHFEYLPPPSGTVVLPEEIVQTHRDFLNALVDAVRKGDAAEDLSNGYSLMANAEAREIQLRFLPIARDNLTLLKQVLKESENAEHRAVAANLLSYSADKKAVVNDLQSAIRDEDEGVRNNAIRSLAAIAVYSQKNDAKDLGIAPVWLVEMLNSVVWSDRNKAAMALATLTENRDETTVELLRERALPSLTEMARWKPLGHALPAYILLGRAKGLPEKQLQDHWSKGDREFVIKARVVSNARSARPGRR